MSEEKSKLQLIGEIAEANNKNLELIEEIDRLNKLLDETRLSELHKEYIINELEKWYEQKWNKLIKFKKDKFYNVDYAKGLSDGYYKLKELKENK